jgi:polyisoprenoid-binding protein YceI
MSTERWEIDNSHSEINFTIRHLVISKVRGRFSRWSGTVLVPDGDWGQASVDVVIDASSIDTGIAARDADLRSANFLDVKRYPEISFRTLQVTAVTGGLQALGQLTMRGRVGQVTLKVDGPGTTRDPQGNERARFSAQAAIRRGDFGASGNVVWDRYGIMIGEGIDIEIEVEAVRQPAAAISFLSDIHDPTVPRP